MAATPVPAICDDCGTVFASGFALSAGASSISLIGNKAGPCPNCGGTGSIPNGLYDFVGETLNVATTWSPSRVQRLVAALEAARDAPDPRAAAVAAIGSEEGLAEVAKRLLIPRDAGQFWAFVAALITALALIQSSQHDPQVTVNVETVIRNTIAKPGATSTEPPQPDATRRATDNPRQPKKRPKRGRR